MINDILRVVGVVVPPVAFLAVTLAAWPGNVLSQDAPTQDRTRSPRPSRSASVVASSRKVVVVVGPGPTAVTITLEVGDGTTAPPVVEGPGDEPPRPKPAAIDAVRLLTDRCLNCHTSGTDASGNVRDYCKFPMAVAGATGEASPLFPSFVPASLGKLVDSIRDLKMPPGRPFTDDEFDAVRVWAESKGAPRQPAVPR